MSERGSMSSDTQEGGYLKTYTLDNAAAGERDRLRCVEQAWDPGSIAHLERLGVTEGSDVLMVAAGAGGLAGWVAQRVGPAGSVLATDLDPRHLAWLPERYDNVEVRPHNAVTDELPTGRFDLAHTRLLVSYLPEREAVIAKMAASVKPGGWLIIEDFDSGSLGAAYPTEASEKFRLASIEFFRRAGYDHLTGRRLPGWLRKAGLKDVDASGSVFSLRGSKSAVITPVYLAALRQQRTRMTEAGLISEEDFEKLEQRYEDPEYDHLTHTMMTVWGRRPTAKT
jgi:ubiquinone/menaquinone biosynthesis C-methylase UbiE